MKIEPEGLQALSGEPQPLTSGPQPLRWHRGVSAIIAMSVLGLLSGCAVHYYDTKNCTEHLWGFGHMKMRAVPQRGDEPPFTNAVISFVTGVRTLGFHLGAGEDFGGLVAGWDSRSKMVISSENAHFYLLWPTNSIWLPWDIRDRLFTVRVGSDFPFTNGTFATDSTVTQRKP